MTAPLSLAAWLEEWRALPVIRAQVAAVDSLEVVRDLERCSVGRDRVTALDHIATLLDALARDEVQP